MLRKQLCLVNQGAAETVSLHALDPDTGNIAARIILTVQVRMIAKQNMCSQSTTLHLSTHVPYGQQAPRRTTVYSLTMLDAPTHSLGKCRLMPSARLGSQCAYVCAYVCVYV